MNLHKETRPLPRYIAGTGSPNAKLFIIGDAPEWYAEQEGQPFSGPNGDLLDSILEEYGVNRYECYLTNLIKYRPPNDNLDNISEIGITVQDGIEQVFRELEAIDPNCILLLERTGASYGKSILLKSLTGQEGITKWRGSTLQTTCGRWKVVPAIHPSNFLPSKHQVSAQVRVYSKLDYKRAVEESKFKEYKIPRPLLIQAKNSLDVHRFLIECRQKALRVNNRCLIAADIEVYKSIPTLIAFAYNEHNAMSIPLLDLGSTLNTFGLNLEDQLQIIKMVGAFLDSDDVTFLWQNGKFDKERLLNTWLMRCRNTYADTSLLAHTINPEFPKSLAFNASIYTKVPYYKDEGKEVDPNVNWEKRKTQFMMYNARDTTTCYAIFKEQIKDTVELGLEDFFFNYVMKMDDFYAKMEKRGFVVNEKKRVELLHKYLTWEEKLQKETEELIGHRININSVIQIKKLLYDELGFAVGNGKTDEATLVMLIANHCMNDKDDRRRRILRNISVKRRVSKTIGTYLCSPADYDGRMRTIYRLAVTEEGKAGGTETGRTSTSTLKPPVRPEEMGMAFQTITKHGDIGPDVRNMLEADDGYVLLEADLSQAEARIAAHLSLDEETLKRFDTEDIHRRTASWCFGVPYEKIEKKSAERQIGKTTRYLRQYRGGKKQLMHTLMSDAFRANIDFYVSEWKCGQIIEKFDAYTPKLASVFWAEVELCLERNRTLINPFGRRRMFFADEGDNLLREALPYLCSSTTKDALTMAMLRIEERKPGTLWMLEAHDACLLMCRESEVDSYKSMLKEELEKPIDFELCSLSRGKLIIPCEMKIGKNYGEMVDLK